MAKINFGGVEENVVTREEFPLEKAREVLKKRNHRRHRLRRAGSGAVAQPQGQRPERHRRPARGQQELGEGRRRRLGAGQDALRHRRGRRARDDHPVPAVRRGSDRRMAHHRKTPHAGQGALLLARLRHHLQGTHGYRAPGRRGRDPDRPQRFGHLAAAHVPAGPGTQFELCGLPRRHGPRLRARGGAGHRRRFGLPVRNRLQTRGLLRPDGRARHADGRHSGHFRRPVRDASRQRPHPPRKPSTRRSRS